MQMVYRLKCYSQVKQHEFLACILIVMALFLHSLCTKSILHWLTSQWPSSWPRRSPHQSQTTWRLSATGQLGSRWCNRSRPESEWLPAPSGWPFLLTPAPRQRSPSHQLGLQNRLGRTKLCFNAILPHTGRSTYFRFFFEHLKNWRSARKKIKPSFANKNSRKFGFQGLIFKLFNH